MIYHRAAPWEKKDHSGNVTCACTCTCTCKGDYRNGNTFKRNYLWVVRWHPYRNLPVQELPEQELPVRQAGPVADLSGGCSGSGCCSWLLGLRQLGWRLEGLSLKLKVLSPQHLCAVAPLRLTLVIWSRRLVIQYLQIWSRLLPLMVYILVISKYVDNKGQRSGGGCCHPEGSALLLTPACAPVG